MSIRPFRDIKRRKTKKIKVGKVEVGGDSPITVQSMTNTLTTNVSETIKQINELTEAAKNYSTIGDIDGESNGWAISGEKTYSSFPLVAGDSHRSLDTPNVYYQIHLKCKDFESIGFTIPGYPGILHFAHNQNVAWGMTHGGGDTQDLFLEKLRTKDKHIQFY